MSDRPQRTNTYTAEPVSDRYRECLFNWLAAHAPLWNQLTYRRRQQYFNEDGDVWDAEYTDLYERYAPLLGKATCQQLARKTVKPGAATLSYSPNTGMNRIRQ